MDKLTMAHEYLRDIIKASGGNIDLVDMPLVAWRLADAMQAEAEKRKPSGLPEALWGWKKGKEPAKSLLKTTNKEEYQPDWNQAPDDATHYVIFADGLAYWYKSKKLECFDIAPSFGIVGMCVVERPHGF